MSETEQATAQPSTSASYDAAIKRFVKSTGFTVDPKKTTNGIWVPLDIDVGTGVTLEVLIRYVPPHDGFLASLQKAREAAGGQLGKLFYNTTLIKVLAEVAMDFRTRFDAYNFLTREEIAGGLKAKDMLAELMRLAGADPNTIVPTIDPDTKLEYQFEVPYLYQTRDNQLPVLFKYDSEQLPNIVQSYGYEAFAPLMSASSEINRFKKTL